MNQEVVVRGELSYGSMLPLLCIEREVNAPQDYNVLEPVAEPHLK